MYGAILGDMIGAPYEFDQGEKTKDFELFNPRVHYTDDTAMTLAVARALLQAGRDADEATMKRAFVECMQDIGRRYAAGEYGGRFAGWLRAPDPQPYNSWQWFCHARECGRLVFPHSRAHPRGGAMVCRSYPQPPRRN